MSRRRRWKTKQEVVMRLLAGESPDTVACDINESVALVSGWYRTFVRAAEKTLTSRERQQVVASVRTGESIGSIASRLGCQREDAGAWWDDYLGAGRKSLRQYPGRLFVISGGSTTGKTTLLNLMKDDNSIHAVGLRKFSTRKRRGPDDDVVTVDDVRDSEYDFAYPFNNERHGIKADDVREIIDHGANGIVVITPTRIVTEIKKHFGPLAVCLYLYRGEGFATEQKERVSRLLRERHGDDLLRLMEEIDTRAGNLRALWREYIQNIALYVQTPVEKRGEGRAKNVAPRPLYPVT